MNTKNQTPIETFRKLAQDPNAAASAQASQAGFGRACAAFTEMQSFDFLLIAVNRHPHASPLTAVKLLSEEVDSFAAMAKSLRADFQRTRVSEMNRLECFDVAALQRSREIDELLDASMKMRISALNRIESETENFKKLKESGLSQDQIDLIVEVALKPDEIQQIYEASVAPALQEREAINRYRQTFDETQLPSVVLERVRKVQAEAAQ